MYGGFVDSPATQWHPRGVCGLGNWLKLQDEAERTVSMMCVLPASVMLRVLKNAGFEKCNADHKTSCELRYLCLTVSSAGVRPVWVLSYIWTQHCCHMTRGQGPEL